MNTLSLVINSANGLPYYYKAGSIIPNYPKVKNLKRRPENLILKFIPGADGEAKFYEDENDTEGYRSDKYTFTRMKQSIMDNRRTLTVYPAEGSFPGMPESRSYTIELPYSACPASVTVNGTVYPQEASGSEGTWSYDATEKTTTIRIPRTTCSNTLTVEVDI